MGWNAGPGRHGCGKVGGSHGRAGTSPTAPPRNPTGGGKLSPMPTANIAVRLAAGGSVRAQGILEFAALITAAVHIRFDCSLATPMSWTYSQSTSMLSQTSFLRSPASSPLIARRCDMPHGAEGAPREPPLAVRDGGRGRRVEPHRVYMGTFPERRRRRRRGARRLRRHHERELRPPALRRFGHQPLVVRPLGGPCGATAASSRRQGVAWAPPHGEPLSEGRQGARGSSSRWPSSSGVGVRGAPRRRRREVGSWQIPKRNGRSLGRGRVAVGHAGA